jgi:glutamate synthase (NADPH/NADH) large chain
VLGTTGSNFAAGMSGGIAYVLDERGDFARHCNQSMVELEPILDEDEAIEAMEHRGGDLEAHGLVDIMHNMTQGDAQRLKRLIQRHVQFTDSPRGKEILADWDLYKSRFVKVMPIEYRRALQQMQAKSRATERPQVSLAVGA